MSTQKYVDEIISICQQHPDHGESQLEHIIAEHKFEYTPELLLDVHEYASNLFDIQLARWDEQIGLPKVIKKT
jgi:hypothetical protein